MNKTFELLQKVAHQLGFRFTDFGYDAQPREHRGYGIVRDSSSSNSGSYANMKTLEESAFVLKGVAVGMLAQIERTNDEGTKSTQQLLKSILQTNTVLT